MLLVIVLVICIVLTVGIAFLLGSSSTDLFDFKNLNLSNVIPVLVIGGFITCVAVGIIVLFVAKETFLKVKKHLYDDNGGDKK